MRINKLLLIILLLSISLVFLKLTVSAQSQTNKIQTTTTIEVFTSDNGSQGRQMVTTCKGQTITRAQLQQELRDAYYPGPWTLAEELAAYQRAACPNQGRKDCLVCDQNKWRLLGGTGECKDSFPACDGNDAKSYEGCFPKGQKPGDVCTTAPILPERCFVCDQGKWRLSGGKCYEDTVVCKADDNNTFGGCKDGGAKTGDTCDTAYKTSLNSIFKLKSAVAGIAVNSDTLITNSSDNNEYLSFKPCTKDISNNQVNDVFLVFNVRRVDLEGNSTMLINETKFPNCDIKKISKTDLSNLDNLARLEISAAYLADPSSNYASSQASSISLANSNVGTRAAVSAKPFVKIVSFPLAITQADNEAILIAVTSQVAKNNNFEVESGGNTQKLAPTNNGFTYLCASSKGSCVYQLKLNNNLGPTKFRFCVDDNICDNLSLQLNPPAATGNAQQNNNNNFVNNTDIQKVVLSLSTEGDQEVPLDGGQIDIDVSNYLQNNTEAIGFLKVYYKDGHYDLVALKFKQEITPEEDGYGGCCESNSTDRVKACPPPQRCTQQNGVCSTGLSCE